MLRLPALSISVGRSSVVVQRPSTMYLYWIFSPQGIWAVPSKKPELVLVRWREADHCLCEGGA